MLDFSRIEQKDWRYNLGMRWVQPTHNYCYYHKVYIFGRENLPEEGYMLLSNHQNGLNDACLPLCSLNNTERRPVFIARADIFNNPIIGRLMRWMKILPAFRVRDTGHEHVEDNNIIFHRAAEILHNGGVVGLFPEAVAHRDLTVLPLKKGFARIAFEAASMGTERLPLIPMVNWYSEHEHPMADAGLWYGEPVYFDDLMELYREQPQRAYTLLCERMQDALVALSEKRDQWVQTQYEPERRPWLRRLLWAVPGLAGGLINIIPVAITELVAGVLVKNHILKGSIRMAFGLFFMPVLWHLPVALIIGIWAGPLWGLAALLTQLAGWAAWARFRF